MYIKKVKNNDDFYNKFFKKYPNFEILEYKNLTSPIIFKDDENNIHRKNIALKCLSHGVRVDSIINKDEYVSKKLKQIHPNLKLIKFNGFKSKVEVEDENGFIYTPICSDLLNGHTVSIQTCTNKEDLFIFKSNIIHNNLYTYGPFTYINGKTKINAICKLHGIFNPTAESHLLGIGCIKCNCGGFSKESWMKKTKNRDGIFYVLKMYNKNEEFIKIGITSKSIGDRYKYIKDYKYDILYSFINTPSYVYDFEKYILKEFKNKKYIPKINFGGGHTECLDIKYLNEILIKLKQ